ncbi:hypothetical protein BN1708_019019, partial [Verticillium longisporum]
RRPPADVPGRLCRRRRTHGPQPARAGPLAGGAARHDHGRPQGVADQDARLRPRRRPALRHHLGLPQGRPRLRPGRRPLLPRTHAPVGRGPPLRRPPHGRHRLGGRRPRRQLAAAPRHGRLHGRPADRHARGPHPPRPRRRRPEPRPQEHPRLPRPQQRLLGP